MSEYKLNDIDVQHLHDAYRLLACDGPTEVYETLHYLVAKFPLPEPPKPVRYRLREGFTIEARHGLPDDIRGTRLYLCDSDGTEIHSVKADAFEPIPDKPAKVAGEFKRGDYVTHPDYDGVGIVIEDDTTDGEVVVHFNGTYRGVYRVKRRNLSMDNSLK